VVHTIVRRTVVLRRLRSRPQRYRVLYCTRYDDDLTPKKSFFQYQNSVQTLYPALRSYCIWTTRATPLARKEKDRGLVLDSLTGCFDPIDIIDFQLGTIEKIISFSTVVLVQNILNTVKVLCDGTLTVNIRVLDSNLLSKTLTRPHFLFLRHFCSHYCTVAAFPSKNAASTMANISGFGGCCCRFLIGNNDNDDNDMRIHQHIQNFQSLLQGKKWISIIDINKYDCCNNNNNNDDNDMRIHQHIQNFQSLLQGKKWISIIDINKYDCCNNNNNNNNNNNGTGILRSIGGYDRGRHFYLV
jgi:hypothetical protein